jgi:GDP-D-mannose 3', 5'-epimerase
MDYDTRVIVTGAGGFIGHHLVKYLKVLGHTDVLGIDLKHPEFEQSFADTFYITDLRDQAQLSMIVDEFKEGSSIFALAADMGGMGYIADNSSKIMSNNSIININTLAISAGRNFSQYFFSSSACVYPEYLQNDENTFKGGLKEEDAYPAQPQDGYGWEKLYTEILGKYYRETFGLNIHIARFHNVFGPLGTWTGGKEKAPAALCRKVAEAKRDGKDYIEIWGDGKQLRSFCYIDDIVKGIYKLSQTDYHEPVNLGQDRMVSIDELADMVMDAAKVKLEKKHVEGPVGVRARNSENTLSKSLLDWDYDISLEDGIDKTYFWIEREVNNASSSNSN